MRLLFNCNLVTHTARVPAALGIVEAQADLSIRLASPFARHQRCLRLHTRQWEHRLRDSILRDERDLEINVLVERAETPLHQIARLHVHIYLSLTHLYQPHVFHTAVGKRDDVGQRGGVLWVSGGNEMYIGSRAT